MAYPGQASYQTREGFVNNQNMMNQTAQNQNLIYQNVPGYGNLVPSSMAGGSYQIDGGTQAQNQFNMTQQMVLAAQNQNLNGMLPNLVYANLNPQLDSGQHPGPQGPLYYPELPTNQAAAQQQMQFALQKLCSSFLTQNQQNQNSHQFQNNGLSTNCNNTTMAGHDLRSRYHSTMSMGPASGPNQAVQNQAPGQPPQPQPQPPGPGQQINSNQQSQIYQQAQFQNQQRGFNQENDAFNGYPSQQSLQRLQQIKQQAAASYQQPNLHQPPHNQGQPSYHPNGRVNAQGVAAATLPRPGQNQSQNQNLNQNQKIDLDKNDLGWQKLQTTTTNTNTGTATGSGSQVSSSQVSSSQVSSSQISSNKSVSTEFRQRIGSDQSHFTSISQQPRNPLFNSGGKISQALDIKPPPNMISDIESNIETNINNPGNKP